MSIRELKREIKELKQAFISSTEPAFKVFIFLKNGRTQAGETEADVQAYIGTHPHTRTVKLYLKDCSKTENARIC